MEWREKTKFESTWALTQMCSPKQGGSLHSLCHIISWDSPWTAAQSFKESLRLQTCHHSLCGHSAPQQTVRGLKVSRMIVMITINYLFIAHWILRHWAPTKSCFSQQQVQAFSSWTPLYGWEDSWDSHLETREAEYLVLQLLSSLTVFMPDRNKSFLCLAAHRLRGWRGLFCWAHSPPEIQRQHLNTHTLHWPKMEPEVWFPILWQVNTWKMCFFLWKSV